MIKHIVAWRIADGEDKAARIKDIKENLEALKDKIPVLVDIHVGTNFNTTENASDVVLECVFKTRVDLDNYRDHPEHKAVGQSYVRPFVKERRVIDYEF